VSTVTIRAHARGLGLLPGGRQHGWLVWTLTRIHAAGLAENGMVGLRLNGPSVNLDPRCPAAPGILSSRGRGEMLPRCLTPQDSDKQHDVQRGTFVGLSEA